MNGNLMSKWRSSRKGTTMMMVLMLAVILLIAGCGGGSNKANDTSGGGGNGGKATDTPATQTPATDAPAADGGVDTSGNKPVVTIEMDSGKIIKMELYPKVAPNTVNNFISLVKKGFYDGVIFHRVIPGFMIQGGDPDGTGAGGPDYSIAGEFGSNGFENNLKHTMGVLSMARTNDPNSAGSQFFIMAADAPSLDNEYAAFGKVTEGIEVVDEIVNLERDASDKPLTPPVMKKVTVDTLGDEYPEPEKVK
ncbi:peptidylprolyl isomerase [Paenibacillus sp. GCM10023252]|uniref:peptidylprolyl isomerase n=1 Tax=Paenibacillus sp. GCM10023252 TaxID=3252649 RepID=UPI00360663E2